MTEPPDHEFRSPSTEDLSMIVRLLRTSNGWTQETLAELAGVSSRTDDAAGGRLDADGGPPPHQSRSPPS